MSAGLNSSPPVLDQKSEQKSEVDMLTLVKSWESCHWLPPGSTHDRQMIIFGFRLISDVINQLDFMLYNIQCVTIL